MLLSHFEWLCTILPSLTAATPQDSLRTRSSSSLPAKLQQDVPACAQPCLRSSLSEQFPLACTSPVDLTCLCSRYSKNGKSLGEVALGCIYTSCSAPDRTAAEAYNICRGEKSAVLPTLTALTVAAKSSTVMTSSRSVVTIKSSTITPTVTSRLPSATDSVVVDSISAVPSPTSTPSAITARPVAAADRPQTMKPAQIAGLAVAAAATFIIAIALMALSIFLRRRRERKKVIEVNEKKRLNPPPRIYSARFSQYFARDSPSSAPYRQLLTPPPPVLRKPGGPSPGSPPRDASSTSHIGRTAHITAAMKEQGSTSRLDNANLIHPLLRPGAGFSNKSSDSTVPLDQIGLAISAELPGESIVTSKAMQAPHMANMDEKKRRSTRKSYRRSQRRDSALTQDTVFEEDDVRDSRRESKLLPAPPVPIPPIRSFQPSRSPPKFNLGKPLQASTQNRQLPQQPELFLDIPIRHSRSLPSGMLQTEPLSRSRPALATLQAQRTQVTPSIQVQSEQQSTSTAAVTPESANGEDIPEYYFTSYRDQSSKFSTPPNGSHRRKRSPSTVTTKPKFSSSNVSRTTSKASTTARDSISSQTSFETNDANDSTPEDEDDGKQLDDNRLSPVVESPISNLRYPKVPRSSNIWVSRSPHSPLSHQSLDSPDRASEPSSLLVKRRGEQRALQLGSPLQLRSPDRPDLKAHMQKYRQHLRSSSVETWSPVRTSERSTRTQSGLWPKSPAMYEDDVVRPLNVRSKHLQPPPTPGEMQALQSPAWVPRLTPTRQGDDLLISVTYSKGSR